MPEARTDTDVGLKPFQALQANHIDLRTSDDVCLRHDAGAVGIAFDKYE